MAIDSRLRLPEPPLPGASTVTGDAGDMRAQPGRGYELLECLDQLVAAADELPVVLHQFGTTQLSQVLRKSLFLIGRLQQVATLVTTDALTRGEVAASDAGNATQWVTSHVPVFDDTVGEAGPTAAAAAAVADPSLDRRVPVEPRMLRRIAAVAQECQHRKNATVTRALRTGSCTVESARTALTHADTIAPVLPTAGRDEILSWYLALDPSLGTRGLTQLTRAILAQYAPEELAAEDARREDAESLTWSTTATGMTRLVAELSPATAALLKDAILAGAAPRPTTDSGGRRGEDDAGAGHARRDASAGGISPVRGAAFGMKTSGCGPECALGGRVPDERSPGKRRADALVELVLAGAKVCTGTSALESAATALITLSLDTLRTGVGTAATATGDLLDAGTARRLACDADLIPIVLGGRSQPLDVGRRERLVTKGLRAAVLFRDKGCSFPGCDRPPGFCEVHHVIPWWAGGHTSLVNSAMLCCRHHQIVHRRGYTAQITDTGVIWDLTPGRMPGHATARATQSATA